MSFQDLTQDQRSKFAKRSHHAIAARKIGDTLLTYKPTASQILDDLRTRIRLECFSPLSDGPIVRQKLKNQHGSMDRDADRIARFIEQSELAEERKSDWSCNAAP